MLEGLRKGDYDIIIALTESLLAGIEKDGGAKLLGCYVQSKLNWAGNSVLSFKTHSCLVPSGCSASWMVHCIFTLATRLPALFY